MGTLFFDSQVTCEGLLYRESLLASKQFIECADTQLTRQFIIKTGLKPGKNVCFSLSTHYIGAPIYCEYQIPNSNWIGRKLCINLYINHNWNPITIYWKSKSGRTYKLHDTEIDCNDIEFWFEHLDTDLYKKQLFPNQKLPFRLDDLSFQVEVLRLNMDASLTLIKKPDCGIESQVIVSDISSFIAKFNEDSGTKEGKHGFVHNWHPAIDGEEISFEIDLGSAGVVFYKRLLKHLSKMNCFQKLVIG